MTDDRRWGDGTPILTGDVAEPWGSVPAERWVRVMADICSGGLWDVSGCGRCAEDLPISAGLCARIERWQDWHDGLDDRNDSFPKPQFWEQRDDMPIAAFNAEGRAIGWALKAELPDDWTVIVVDVDAWCRHESGPAAEDGELVLRGERSMLPVRHELSRLGDQKMDHRSNRDRAEAALAEIKDAIVAEVAAAGAEGAGNADVARNLGLESSFRGGQRNNLTHALLNGLVEHGRLIREEKGARVFYKAL